MGRIRSVAIFAECGECHAGEDKPCVHRVTGQPIKGMHRSRTYRGRKHVEDEMVREITGDESEDDFFEWVGHYLFCKFREHCLACSGQISLDNQYWGEW